MLEARRETRGRHPEIHEAGQRPRAAAAQYWRCLRIWTALGVPALLAFVVIFYLMVAKPTG